MNCAISTFTRLSYTCMWSVVHSAYSQRLGDSVGFQKPDNDSLVPEVGLQSSKKEKAAWLQDTA